MYISILTGRVSKENWGVLQQSFALAIHRPPEGLTQSILVQCNEDSSLWQIISFWHNEEAYRRAKAHGAADICVNLFCETGSIPERKTYLTRERYTRV